MIQIDFPKTRVQRGTHNEEMKRVPFVTYLHLKRLFGETDTSSVSYINSRLGYTLGTLCSLPQSAYK